MNKYKIPELSSNEKKLPLAKYYYDYPLYHVGPLQQTILDAGPMDPKDAIPAVDWLDLLQTKGYRNIVYGYCMMPDGSGFYINYSTTSPEWNPKWRRWYGKWVNQRSKSMKEGEGNLRCKIWNPIDHWDHKFVNGKDDTDGVWSLEKLDVGLTDDSSKGIPAVSHNIDLKDYGLTSEKEEELDKAGCHVSACYEDFEGPGHHLVLRFSRPAPLGGTEHINCEWIGYLAKDGKIIRDEQTPVDETYLKNVLVHNTIEADHLAQVLPDLYEEYSSKPMDAD